MCGPLEAVSAVLGLASSAASSSSERRARQEQNAFNEARGQITRSLALQSYALESSQVRTRTQQERTQIAEEVRNLTVSSLRLRGKAGAAAAAANVSGGLVGEIQQDIARAEDVTSGRLRTLQEFREAAAEAEIKGIVLTTQARILGGFTPGISGPSGLEIGLRAVSGGLSGLTAGISIAGAFE